MRFRLRTLLICVGVVGIFLGLSRALFYLAAPHVQPSIAYEIRAEFTEMPNDDEPFRQWVEDQPGVYRAYVNRDAAGINVIWGMSRDLTGKPGLPDFKKNFDRFGYRGLKRYEPIP